MLEPLDQEYLLWLSAKVRQLVVPTPSNSYQKLLVKLFTTEFPWLISGDDNRAADGKDLRAQFLQQARIADEPEWRAMPCSILEMLIAFSIRAAFNSGETQELWFWEMIRNLGLEGFVDIMYYETAAEDILQRFVWREYDANGRGGLFPIREPRHDQRQVEIWYQFCDYLLDQDRLP